MAAADSKKKTLNREKKMAACVRKHLEEIRNPFVTSFDKGNLGFFKQFLKDPIGRELF